MKTGRQLVVWPDSRQARPNHAQQTALLELQEAGEIRGPIRTTRHGTGVLRGRDRDGKTMVITTGGLIHFDP